MGVQDASVAEALSALFGTPVTMVDGGLRVKETETGWVDVMRMIFNWRITRTPKAMPETFDRGWCYYGTGHGVLLRAVRAALEWDGGDDTEPPGWDKNAMTGEYREKAART